MNPYASSQATPHANSSGGLLSGLITFLPWLLLGCLLLFARSPFRRVFEDFELELPGLTVVAMSLWFPLAVLATGLVLAVVRLVIGNKRGGGAVVALSTLLWGGCVAFAVLAYFIPLTSLISNLAG